MSSSLLVKHAVFNKLDCLILEDQSLRQETAANLVLCHGYGAPGDDLANVGVWLLQEIPALAKDWRLIFPAAPIDLSEEGMPGGRAWWPINMAQLALMNQMRDFSQLSAISPPGMQQATEQLHEALQQMRSLWKCEFSDFVVGGFSQGAMVTTNLTLSFQLSFAHLCLFSGTLLNADEWRQHASSLPNMSILMSHGNVDTVLPIESAEELRDLLSATGHSVDYLEFAGAHTIPVEAMQKLGTLLQNARATNS